MGWVAQNDLPAALSDEVRAQAADLRHQREELGIGIDARDRRVDRRCAEALRGVPRSAELVFLRWRAAEARVGLCDDDRRGLLYALHRDDGRFHRCGNRVFVLNGDLDAPAESAKHGPRVHNIEHTRSRLHSRLRQRQGDHRPCAHRHRAEDGADRRDDHLRGDGGNKLPHLAVYGSLHGSTKRPACGLVDGPAEDDLWRVPTRRTVDIQHRPQPLGLRILFRRFEDIQQDLGLVHAAVAAVHRLTGREDILPDRYIVPTNHVRILPVDARNGRAPSRPKNGVGLRGSLRDGAPDRRRGCLQNEDRKVALDACGRGVGDQD